VYDFSRSSFDNVTMPHNGNAALGGLAVPLHRATPTYVPVVFFSWWYHYDANTPSIFTEDAALRPSAASR
jgi:hypothetical protein